MADSRYTMIFVAALATAGAATYGVWRVLENTREASRVATQAVVVAAQDMPEGALIDQLMISVGQWPVPTVPAGAYSSTDSVVGRVTRVPVFKGEPIVPGRLAPPGTGAGLVVKIAPGKRATAVKIDEVSGLSGLIQPDSRVDVLVTLAEDGNRNDQVAKLFMSNMRVLSVGTQVTRGEDGRAINATTAALEVTPEEAEQLAIAQQQGKIQLVLRGYGDPDSVTTGGAKAQDVLNQLRDAAAARTQTRPTTPRPAVRPPAQRTTPAPEPQPVVQQPQRPESTTVRVIRGSDVKVQKFERDSTGSTPPGN
jgi:pilus assembly protein CpaB